MTGSVFWLFVIIAFSTFIGYVGVVLFRWFSQIRIDLSGENQLEDESSVLDWFNISWKRLRKGDLHISKILVPISAQPPDQELIDSGTHSNNQTDVGSDGSESEEINREQQLAKVSFSVEIPLGASIRFTIDAISQADGSPSVSIKTDHDQTDPDVKVQVTSGDILLKPDLVVKSSDSNKRGKKPAWFIGTISAIKKIPLEPVLFVSSIIVYLLTRLIGLNHFPIYFFTDEAIHTILAETLINNRLQYNGQFLPAFFPMGASFGLNGISVYLQVLPLILFGKSVFVTRAVSVVITTLGAIAVGLTLKDFFKLRYWWSGVLILSITPVWFLHSRTAFEYVELASFYALFIYFYLSYRLRSPKFLYFAIISGALVFYTHGLGQFLMVITTVALSIVDYRYHFQQRKTILIGILLIIVLGLPYIRFVRSNPLMFEEQMRMRGSYWLDQNLSSADKILKFGKEYFAGLNPIYWFIPGSSRDLARHQMKGYGNLILYSLPFFLFGLWLTFRNIRSPAYRTILITLLVSPFGAALAQITNLRIIWLVIPAVILTTLGIAAFVDWLVKKGLSITLANLGLFVLLVAANLYILQDALHRGPLWFQDYSLYGMQYGAEQVFGQAVPEILKQQPNTQFVVTPTWANGTDNFVRFFLSPEQQTHVRLDSIQAYLFERLPVDDNLLVVLTQSEYDEAVASPKFSRVEPIKVLYYPNGTPGFYFVRLDYSEQADQIFAAEKLARSQPVEAQVIIDGQPVKIVYSQIDMGQPEAIFDGDVHTLMRGLEANPFIIELDFPTPRPISQLSADFANMDFTLSAKLYSDVKGEPVLYETTQRGATGDPHIDLAIDKGPNLVSKLQLEILSLNGGEQPHIHIREIKLAP